MICDRRGIPVFKTRMEHNRVHFRGTLAENCCLFGNFLILLADKNKGLTIFHWQVERPFIAGGTVWDYFAVRGRS